ncbi:hypothetical protein Tco_0189294, partial [Tanacetum coccineum]
ASASVPWIYNQQFWHALKLDDSKDKFKFFIDTKEFKFSVDDFRLEEHLVDAEIEKIVEGNDNVDENQKGKGIVEIKDTPAPTPIRSPRTHSASLSYDKEELQELTASDPTPSSSKPTTSSPKPKSDPVKQYKSTLNDIMKKNLPKIVADRIMSERQKVHNDLATLVAATAKKERESIRAKIFLQVTHDIKFENPVPLVEPCRVFTVRTRDHKDHDDDDVRPEGESIAKRQRTFRHGMFTTSKSSPSQAMNESTPSGSSTQEQLEDFDAWQDGQGTDDDDVPDEEVSTELLDEVSGKVMTSDELQTMQDALSDMLRNKCDSGEEHQYHLDQMQSYMES